MIPDVKKLITGFLIVAAAASSSALILSNTSPSGSSGVGQGGNLADVTAPLLADQNAFVPSQGDILNAAIESNSQVAAALSDPKNLTANYTDAFLNGVAMVNPDGMATSSDGTNDTVTLNQPTAQAVANNFAQSPAVKGLQLPNWDADVAAQKLNITENADISAYSDALNGALEKNLVQTGAQSLVGQQNLDPSNFAVVTPALQAAARDVAQTPTPQKLASFQKSLVAALVYQRNMANLASLAETDPVKASLIYQAQSAKYDAVLQSFGLETEKAAAKGLFSFRSGQGKQNRTMALLEAYFGIQTAHAQWPVTDWVRFGTWIKDTISSIILQILKNVLTAFIQQRALKWIQGSGAPKFVQQFGNQLVQVGQAAAMAATANILEKGGNAVGGNPPGGYKYSCPNIGNLLGPTIANLGLVVPAVKQVPTCSLTISGTQLKDFYKNFSFSGANVVQGGSWGLYAQVLNPSNNYYGALLQSQDYINGQSSQAAQAQQTETVAGSGFTGTKTCTDQSNPNGTHTVCLDKNDVAYHVNSSGSCDPGFFPSLAPNGGLCADGSTPYTTTPGQTTNAIHAEALGGALKLTTNANSIVGVLASIGMSLINTVVQTGISAAVNAGSQAATGGLLAITAPGESGGASSVGGVTPTQPQGPASSSLPQLPPTTCAPKNPTCSNGPGGQCDTSYQGQVINFSATGGDGLTFNWNVGIGRDANGNDVQVVATPASAEGLPVFSPYFTVSSTVNPATGLSNVAFPITIPVNVTGSDGKSDTCLAALSQ